MKLNEIENRADLLQKNIKIKLALTFNNFLTLFRHEYKR